MVEQLVRALREHGNSQHITRSWVWSLLDGLGSYEGADAVVHSLSVYLNEAQTHHWLRKLRKAVIERGYLAQQQRMQAWFITHGFADTWPDDFPLEETEATPGEMDTLVQAMLDSQIEDTQEFIANTMEHITSGGHSAEVELDDIDPEHTGRHVGAQTTMPRVQADDIVNQVGGTVTFNGQQIIIRSVSVEHSNDDFSRVSITGIVPEFGNPHLVGDVQAQPDQITNNKPTLPKKRRRSIEL